MSTALLLVTLACGLARAQVSPGQPLTITFDTASAVADEAVLNGHCEMRETGLLLTADQFRWKGRTDESPEMITAVGHVVYTRGAIRLLADKVVYHRRDRSFTADNIRVGSYPYYIQGRSAAGNADEVTVRQARVSYGEPGPWQPTATAGELTLSTEGHRIRTQGAQVGIGHVQPLPFPKFQQSLGEPLLAGIRLTGGYRGSLGGYVDGGLRLPVAPGLRLGGDLGYYTKRGLLVGPAATYTNPNDPAALNGFLRSGYINDHGDKGTDLLGRYVPEDRAFVEWQHQQTLADGLTLTGQFNWWRDSEVVRDFRPREFFPVQQPDSFVEATQQGANYFVSAFVRLAPNNFEVVQQRAPEVRFDLLPLAVGDGFYERFNASIAMLQERPLASVPFPVDPAVLLPSGTSAAPTAANQNPFTSWTTVPLFATYGTAQELRSTRMDAFYSLSRPIAPNDWFTLTPVAGARVTHYMNTVGAAQNGNYTRMLGEIGADAELRTSGTFAYKNPAWHIDGIRHLFTPKLSYRYIPEAEKGQRYIPAIDRETFSTYLQPLDLGDVRSIDTLHGTNTLRLAFENTLQTRDPKYGSRDLLTFNVADDVRFTRQPGQREVSQIETELAAAPTRWLELGFFNRFSPQSLTMTELNSGITVHDGRAWTVRFANNFLRHQLQDYYIDGRARLNEELDAITQLRYDQRKHRFTEQSYGIVQNLSNTWRISYLVSFYSGRRRESHFGFSIQIDTVRF